MKRTEIRRKSPLCSYTELRNRTPLRAVSVKAQRRNAERTRALRPLREAQPWCALGGCTGVGLDAHELLSRARGGSTTDLDNIVLLCRTHHTYITEHPAWAEANGWALKTVAA